MRQRYASDIGPVYDLNEIEEVLGHRESDQVMELSRRLTTAERERDELRLTCAAMREALEQIANPVAYLQKEAEKRGHNLDGIMAVKLAEDAGYLRRIADKALSSSAGEDMLERVRKAEMLLREIQGRLGSDCSYECSTCGLTDCKEGQIYKDIDACLKGGGKE